MDGLFSCEFFLAGELSLLSLSCRVVNQVLVFLVGVKMRHVHLCWVAGNSV